MTKKINYYKEEKIALLLLSGIVLIFIFSRALNGTKKSHGQGTLVGLVNAALEAGNRQSTESYLTIDAGHGTIPSGWVIDSMLQ